MDESVASDERRPLLRIESLKTHFFVDDGPVRAVDGVTLTVPRGKTVCIVGESGCGKSITGRSVMGLVEHPGRVVDGHIWWSPADGDQRSSAGGRNPLRRSRRHAADSDQDAVDLAALDPRGEALRRIRGNEISMVFQEPMASLSPMYTIAEQLIETIRLHRRMSKRDAYRLGVELLTRVGIPRAEQRMNAYSFQLSGGMCQRVMIAIAIACGPKLLIADEPTTALDVTTQARIIDLLAEIQAETDMSMMFITHDLGVVAQIADEVVVMYLGTVVEQGSVEEIFHDPKHPYTRALLASIPKMGVGARKRPETIRGQVPHPLNRPAGCPFHPRCDQAIAGVCDTSEPPTVELPNGRRVRCVLYDRELVTTAAKGDQAVEATSGGTDE
ncbi:ABC transporter ATP-binding protein [Microlunatus endophyticus]|nr:ABC transporter ATP-binding protein [Microlunatus endophyticus]